MPENESHYIRMGEAAERLGVDYRRLRLLIQRYGIETAENPLDLRERLILEQDVESLEARISTVKKDQALVA